MKRTLDAHVRRRYAAGDPGDDLCGDLIRTFVDDVGDPAAVDEAARYDTAGAPRRLDGA